MSGEVQIRRLDRGDRGELIVTLHREPKPYILYQHINPDGSLGGRLAVAIAEVPILLETLRSAQALAKPKHRTVTASEEIALQIDEDSRLF
jgi:hypothetical protein